MTTETLTITIYDADDPAILAWLEGEITAEEAQEAAQETALAVGPKPTANRGGGNLDHLLCNPYEEYGWDYPHERD